MPPINTINNNSMNIYQDEGLKFVNKRKKSGIPIHTEGDEYLNLNSSL